MSLPSPIPDNPLKWDGWRFYNSDNFYLRLCLEFDSNPSDHQIEEHCRQLLVWWQKKLPLKNQPSNPISQILRAGLDEAPQYLVEARTELLNRESRARLDETLRTEMKQGAIAEFGKFLNFSLSDGFLTKPDEASLYQLGATYGLELEEMQALVDAELEKRGAQRKEDEPPPPPPPPAPAAPPPSSEPSPAMAAQAAGQHNPFDEFRRMLMLSGLDADLTDDQRDALCNMGENLGLTGGQAEDLIDEYIEKIEDNLLTPTTPQNRGSMTTSPARPQAIKAQPLQKAPPKAPEKPAPLPIFTPLSRAQEKAKYPNFINSLGLEMLLVTSGNFFMGSNAAIAAPNEQPVTQVTQTCFYIARYPITNWLYEKFDSAHASKRGLKARDDHPVVYVTSTDAINFCQWLSTREGKKYRLPTEAEWEYAARGIDGRSYPWGEDLERGDLANLADRNTNFAWRDLTIDDGYAETSPVNAYPRGISPFGAEDMAGNVWEWCLDYYEAYKGKDVKNRRGPSAGNNRIYRGGSWKSRAASLRTTARGFNTPDYLANDLGFRIVCECE